MHKPLHCYSASLLLFFIFAVIRTGYSQPAHYASLTEAGRAEHSAGHFGKAETLLRSALEAAQQSRDDYAVAVAQGNLGAVYQDEERRTEAERAFKEALSILRRIPGMNSETAVILRNLGALYSVERRDSDALKTLYEALALTKDNTPAEAAQALNALGIVYFRQGKMKRAESLLAQAMNMRPLAGGHADSIDAQILGNLGAVYEKQHKHGKAEESYRRSLNITEQRLGSAHPFLIPILGNLAGLYTKMRRYRETEAQYRRSLAIMEQMTPAPNGKIVLTLYWLSTNYLQQGEKTSAERVLARAVEIVRRHPVSDPEMPNLLDAYADILKSLGKTQEALRLYAEARRTRLEAALTVRIRKSN